MRRAIVSLIVAVALLAGPRLQAAINLLGSGNARIDYGDVAALAGKNGLSVAVTVTLANPLVMSVFSRFVAQWGDTEAEQAFILCRENLTDEIALYVHYATAFGDYYAFRTTDAPLSGAGGTTLRILCRSRPDVVNECWINGSLRSMTPVLTAGTSPFDLTTDSPNALQIGHETDEAADGVDGDYSEVAIWAGAVPQWVAASYGKGMSPKFYRTDGIFYAPLINTNADGLRDVWGGLLGTNTAGTNAAHPRMYYPTGQ